MILIDAHVHIYDCFNLENIFESAYSNFKSTADRLLYKNDFIGILLLAETSKDNWFHQIANHAVGKNLPDGKKTGNWTFHRTDENYSLYGRSIKPKNLFLIAGQQIVTKEGIELLALGTNERYANGISLTELIESINKTDGIPVIPWGFGKWIGDRGKLLIKLIESKERPRFFLGDNGGRPLVLPAPNQFRLAEEKGIKILPGSDPLPITSESQRIGSFGSSLCGIISKEHPAQDLKQALMDPMVQFQTYGRLENPVRFLCNQIIIRLKKKKLKRVW